MSLCKINSANISIILFSFSIFFFSLQIFDDIIFAFFSLEVSSFLLYEKHLNSGHKIEHFFSLLSSTHLFSRSSYILFMAWWPSQMSIKMVAMGVYGKNTYLADSWNRLDFFIVLSGALEYCLNMENLNLTAIRTIRVLRPLRAINRIPSKK